MDKLGENEGKFVRGEKKDKLLRNTLVRMNLLSPKAEQSVRPKLQSVRHKLIEAIDLPSY